MGTLRNKVQLIGNIGNEPKITNLENGYKVARFSMATNEYYRNVQGEKVRSTQWHYVVAWNKKADIIERYTHKGKEIAIEGKLISRSYTDGAGVKCYVTEIDVSEILLMGTKNKSIPVKEAEEVKGNDRHSEKVEDDKLVEGKKQQVKGVGKSQTRRTRGNKKEAEKAA